MFISRRSAAALTLWPLGLSTLASSVAAAPGKKPENGRLKTHRVAMHINTNDPTLISQALNNAQNLHQYYLQHAERLELRLVAHGPGLHMLRNDTSPVLERLSTMKRDVPLLSLAACANTKRNMERVEGKDVSITEMAEIVPSGVVELVSLQERGWSYLRA